MPALQTTQPQTAYWPIYRTLVGIGVICALIIVTAFEVTLPIIKVNKQQALEKAIFQVLPNGNSFTAYALDESNQFRKATAGKASDVYACFDSNELLIGFAIPAQAMGYQDTIGVLYGFSLQRQAITGLVILQSRETPGLGSKIESPDFLAQFSRVEVRLKLSVGELQHPLELIKNTKKRNPWQIDAITGATVSSRAVVSILNRSLAFWIPVITKHYDKHKERMNLEH
ncbi:FMN-binding protein [Kaarinaea lacus]